MHQTWLIPQIGDIVTVSAYNGDRDGDIGEVVKISESGNLFYVKFPDRPGALRYYLGEVRVRPHADDMMPNVIRVTQKCIVDNQPITLVDYYIVISGINRVRHLTHMATGSTIVFVCNVDTDEHFQVNTDKLIFSQ